MNLNGDYQIRVLVLIGKTYKIEDLEFHFPDTLCIRSDNKKTSMFMPIELFTDNKYVRKLKNKYVRKLKLEKFENKFFIENLEKPLKFRPATEQDIENYKIKMEKLRIKLERKLKLEQLNKL